MSMESEKYALIYPKWFHPICFISLFSWPLSMDSEEHALIFPKWLHPYVFFSVFSRPLGMDSEEYPLLFPKHGSTLYALFQYLAGPSAWTMRKTL
jgi:hypothetical protein